MIPPSHLDWIDRARDLGWVGRRVATRARLRALDVANGVDARTFLDLEPGVWDAVERGEPAPRSWWQLWRPRVRWTPESRLDAAHTAVLQRMRTISSSPEPLLLTLWNTLPDDNRREPRFDRSLSHALACGHPDGFGADRLGHHEEPGLRIAAWRLDVGRYLCFLELDERPRWSRRFVTLFPAESWLMERRGMLGSEEEQHSLFFRPPGVKLSRRPRFGVARHMSLEEQAQSRPPPHVRIDVKARDLEIMRVVRTALEAGGGRLHGSAR